MRRLKWIACIAALSTASVACGDPDQVQQGAATETAATVPSFTTILLGSAVTAGETVAVSDAVTNQSVLDPAPDPGIADPGTPDTAEVVQLGGVTVDDPLPPQSDATDPATAEVAVRYAYSHWILIDLDKHLRSILVEFGEDDVDGFESRIQAVRDLIERARLQVDEVQFTDSEHADVVFHVEYNDGPSPYFPDPLHGTAVFQNGTWRLSRQTLCLLAIGAGQGCNQSDPTNPVPPTAMLVGWLPSGFEPAQMGAPGIDVGGELADQPLPVPGFGVFTDEQGEVGQVDVQDRQLSVSTEVLAGSSRLSEADLDVVLASSRYGTQHGEIVTVAGHRARLAEENGALNLVYVRGDDVVVHVFGLGVSADDLVGVAEGLQPVIG